jgi:hypothetical protein
MSKFIDLLGSDNPEDYVEIDVKDAEKYGVRAAIIKTLANRGLSPNEIFQHMKGILSKATINRHYPRKRQAEPGHIYLIQGVHGWHKIGLSKDPVSRIGHLDVILPFDIEVLYLIPTNDMKRAERQLHQRFAEKRGKGEWFALSQDDIETICAIPEMVFEVQS